MQDFEAGIVLVPYEFDTATMLYGDVRSVIEHHDRRKSRCTPYLRSLYDLRSGAVLSTAAAILQVMKDHTAATRLSPQHYRSLQAFEESLGGLDPQVAALHYFGLALEQNPTLAEALYHKGRMLRGLGRHEEALSLFRAARGLTPSIIPLPQDIALEGRVLFECGQLLEEQGLYAEAMDSYRQAVEFMPHFSNAQRRYAACLQRTGKWEEAANSYRYALIFAASMPTLPKLPAVTAKATRQRQAHPPRFRTDLNKGPRRGSSIVLGHYDGFNLVRVFGTYHAVLHGEGVFDIRRAQAGEYTHWFSGDSAEKIRSQIDELPHLVEGRRDFNIVKTGRQYHAIPKGEGEFDVNDARTGQYSNWFYSEALEEVRSKVDGVPQLVAEDYCGFNIVWVRGAYHAIAPSAGGVVLAHAHDSRQANWSSNPFLEKLLQQIRAIKRDMEAAALGNALDGPWSASTAPAKLRKLCQQMLLSSKDQVRWIKGRLILITHRHNQLIRRFLGPIVSVLHRKDIAACRARRSERKCRIDR